MNEVFFKRLKDIRKSKNLTLKQVAQENAIAIGFLSDIENGKAGASFENIVKLAQYYNVSIDYLAGLSDSQEINR